MARSGKGLICPLYGGECVGIERCAPAVYGATLDDESTTDSGEPEMQAEKNAACPIVAVCGGLTVLATSLLGMLTTQAMADEKIESKIEAPHLPGGLVPDQM